jgi:RNA polymerase sigma factor (sigma-70 family)
MGDPVRLTPGEVIAEVEALVAARRGYYEALARRFAPAELAEDVVADAVLRAMERSAQYEGRAKVETWFFRIVSSVAKNAGARQRRGLVPLLFDLASDDDDSPDRVLYTRQSPLALRVLIDARPGPEGMAVLREEAQEAQEALASLPERSRRALEMAIDGVPYAAIGEVLDLQEPGVKSLVLRARQRARRGARGGDRARRSA